MNYSCVVVLGMHRSGTSLLANILQELGVNMGKRFRQADQHNPYGYFEDLDWRDLNQAILRSTHSSWWNPPTVNAIVGEETRIGARIATLVEQKASQGEMWGFKDPRSCITVPIIHPYLPNPIYVSIHRNTEAVRRSLKHRAKLRGYRENDEHWYDLIRTYERRKSDFLSGMGINKHVLSYEQLINEPEETVTKLANAIGIFDKLLIHRACEAVQ